VNKLLSIRAGDMLTIAGRQFMVQAVDGTGWSMRLVLNTTRLFVGREGRLTNQLRLTLDELLDSLIVVHKRFDKTV